VGEILRAQDWSNTALGPPRTWPPPLRAALAICLNAPVVSAIYWGPEFRVFYNDAYVPVLGPRHPAALGQPLAQILPEAWAVLRPQLDGVRATGRGFTVENQRLNLRRHGRSEESFWTYSFTPIHDETDATVAVFVTALETTDHIRAQRGEGGGRDSEAFIRLLLNSTSEAFYSVDRTGTTTLCNKAFAAMLGFARPEDAVGRTLHDVIHHSHPDGSHYARADCPIYRAASSGEPAHVSDELFFRLDGTSFPVEYRAEPIFRDGILEGAICTFIDITDRRAAEHALRQSEALLRNVAQAMPNHVWTAQPNGQLDWFNDRAFDYTGMREGELTGDDWIRFVHPDDLGGAAERWGAAVATGHTYEIEFRLRRHDGVYRWHIGRAVPIRSAAGEITRWIGTNTDIEDQKAAAQALTLQNDTLERRVAERTAERDQVWRNAQDLMAVLDARGTILSINDAWTAHLGWRPADLVGIVFFEFTHPDDLADTMAAFAGLLETPVTSSYEFRFRGRDGAYKWFGWTGAFEAERAYVNGRHTTIEREQAQALAASQEALRQSQKMEAVGQLTGGIAHDFNNMLSIIIGSLDIATRRLRRGDEGIEKYIAHAQDGARRAATLTQRLLAFSRQSPLSPSVLNLNSLLANMSELLRSTLGEPIVLEAVLAGGLWPTHADPNQLENAIINLAVNARDAMPHGGKLTLETANAHLDDRYAAGEPGLIAGQYVMIAVSDDGEGIDADTLRRVFDPFFTTKPVGKGTGLGLSMVYGFAKQSGGHVRIYSEPRRGTTVKIYLPRHFGSLVEAAGAANPQSLPTAAADAEIVLVVEDEARVRAMSCEALRELGYTVHEAASGEEALRIFAALDKVDLVFTDVVMAGMSGRQLADALRAASPGLKVLYTTGYTRNAVVHNGVLDKGVAFLPKPFSVEELAVKLRAVLDA
jgi:PAS domain S-box-containing protein